jgi:Fe-S-cluster containining protein
VNTPEQKPPDAAKLNCRRQSSRVNTPEQNPPKEGQTPPEESLNEFSWAIELQVLYDDLDATIRESGPVCDLSGRCCRFKEYGHTLFLSRPEAQLLLKEGLPANSQIDEASCPFQINGLCTAREKRPIGCRIFFCDPNYAGKGESISETYVDRLKRLHDDSGTAWEYRPMHDFLREFAAPASDST